MLEKEIRGKRKQLSDVCRLVVLADLRRIYRSEERGGRLIIGVQIVVREIFQRPSGEIERCWSIDCPLTCLQHVD